MKYYSSGERVASAINLILLLLFAAATLVPLLSVLATSFSSKLAVDMNTVKLWPVQFTLDSWQYLLFRKDLWLSFGITAASTAIGTFLAVTITALMAYPLSKSEFKLGKYLMLAVVITMIFKAPIVPYFLTVRGIGLFNNPLVLVIPHVVSAYCLAIMRTSFKQFPRELEESAVVDGCGMFRTLFQIVVPSSMAVIATVGLLYGVTIWNQYQTPLLFIQDQTLFPLQMKIKQYIVDGNEFALRTASFVNYNERTLRAATVVFAIVPMIMIYPFLQKYFVKGAMLGSVKG